MVTINLKNQSELETALRIENVLGMETLLKNYNTTKLNLQWEIN